jgi:hypothetical protein
MINELNNIFTAATGISMSSMVDDLIAEELSKHSKTEAGTEELWKPKSGKDVIGDIFRAARQWESPYVAAATSWNQVHARITRNEAEYLLNAPRKLKKERNKNGTFVSVRSKRGRQKARVKLRIDRMLAKLPAEFIL